MTRYYQLSDIAKRFSHFIENIGVDGFEKRFSANGIELYDDYGHHPNEIKATILASRDRFPKSRIIVIFQPHTFSRTQALLSDFAQVLSLADYSFILPIFASARENKEQFTVTSKNIAEKANKKEVIAVENNQAIIAQLELFLRPGDVIITMGAGDVYKIENDIIEVISKLKC